MGLNSLAQISQVSRSLAGRVLERDSGGTHRGLEGYSSGTHVGLEGGLLQMHQSMVPEEMAVLPGISEDAEARA
jgi:hypothetical protein